MRAGVRAGAFVALIAAAACGSFAETQTGTDAGAGASSSSSSSGATTSSSSGSTTAEGVKLVQLHVYSPTAPAILDPTFDEAVTPGNTVIIAVTGDTTSGPPPSIKVGSTVAVRRGSVDAPASVSIWSVKITSAAAKDVLIDNGANVKNISAILTEWSGLPDNDSYEASTKNDSTGTSTMPDTEALQGSPKDMLFAALTVKASKPTSTSSSWTSLTQTDNGPIGFAAAFLVLDSNAPRAASWTVAPAGLWGTVIVKFRAP